jgi:hypothetical protein
MSRKSFSAAILLTLFFLASALSWAQLAEAQDLGGIGARVRTHVHHKLVPLLGHHGHHNFGNQSRKFIAGNTVPRETVSGNIFATDLSKVACKFSLLLKYSNVYLAEKRWLLFCSLLI